MTRMRSFSWIVAFLAGCGIARSPDRVGSPGDGNGSAGDMGVGGPGGPTLSDGGGTLPFDRDAACERVSATAKPQSKKPVDIIFLIDASESMDEEIAAVENNINLNFAQIIGASSVDYQVILIANFDLSATNRVCIKPPLGGNTCAPGETKPINTAKFFHYDEWVGSIDSLGRILRTYNAADQHNTAPKGWQALLRPQAIKVFVEITDDKTNKPYPETADAFETELFKLMPKHFGDANDRNYIFHSIVGVASNPLGKSVAYLPSEPIVSGTCSSAQNPGTEYQKLSQRTHGLRFPVCNYQSYDAVFQEIAKGVIQSSRVGCDFQIPTAPAPWSVDLSTITIDYTPGGGGAKETFQQVPNAAQCAPGKFYVDGTARKIVLCPSTCDTVKNDDKAQVQIFFSCSAPIP